MARRFKVRGYKSSLNIPTGSPKVDTGSDWVGDLTTLTFCCWAKFTNNGSSTIIDNGNTIWNLTSNGSKGDTRLSFSNNAFTTTAATATGSMITGRWYFIAVVRNSNGTVTQYINGVTSGTVGAAAGTVQVGTGNVWLGNRLSDTARPMRGNLSRFRAFNKVLSQTEIQNIMYDDTLPQDSATSMVAEYLCEEGAGSILNDTSGNLRHGTITTATFISDVPFIARKDVNPNLIKNGSIDYIPPFTAAGTTSLRWMDGSASGSTTNDLFGWAQVVDTASASAQFDSTNSKVGKYSLRVDTLDAAGRARVVQGAGSGGTAGSIAIATLKKYGIPVKPSTSYTFGAWVKYTNVLTGNCNFQIDEMDGTGTRVASSNNAFGSGTSDWVYKTLTFTTSATTQFLVLALGFNSVGEVKTAWFDDVSLYPTTPVTRTTNTQRRFNVRDNNYSLFFNGTNSYAGGTPSVPLGIGDAMSVSFWFKVNKLGLTQTFLSYKRDATNQFTIGIRDTTSRIECAFYNGTTYFQGRKTSSLVVPNKWNHCVYTTDGSTTKMYLNGVLDDGGSANLGGALGNNNQYTIGQRNDRPGTGSVSGNILDMVIWNRELSATDISKIYYEGAGDNSDPIFSQVVLRWKMQEGSGTTINDSISGTYNGTTSAASFKADVPFESRTNV